MKTNSFTVLLLVMLSLFGCNVESPSWREAPDHAEMACDSTLHTFEVIQWPRDSMVFSLPLYSWNYEKSFLECKEEASFPWLTNGFGSDIPPELVDDFDDLHYYKEGVIYQDSCRYVLIWVHDEGTSISLFLCKMSANCELLTHEKLAKSLWIPGVKILHSSVLRNSGELISKTLSVAIEVDQRLGDVPPDTLWKSTKRTLQATKCNNENDPTTNRSRKL
jgi:hypothetical protein